MTSAVSVIEVIENIVIKGPEENGHDDGFMSKIKEVLNDFSNSMKNKHYAFDLFEKNFLFLKSFGLAFLIILSVVNYVYYKNTGLISKKPFLFFTESCVFGLSGVVPFIMLCYFRNNNHFTKQQILNISIALFLVFFGLTYLLELSGIYPTIFQKEEEKEEENKDEKEHENKDEKEEENKEEKEHENKEEKEHEKVEENNFDKLKKNLGITSDIVLLIIFVVSIFSLFFATAFVRDVSPDYINLQSLSPYLVFGVEMILFGVISAVPVFFMASNRGVLSSNTTKEFLLIVLKFSLLHCVLQLSGFYRYLFTGDV